MGESAEAEGKWLVKDHLVSSWQRKDLNSAFSDLELRHLATIVHSYSMHSRLVQNNYTEE